MRYRTQVLTDCKFIELVQAYVCELNGSFRPHGNFTVFFGRKENSEGQTEGPLGIEFDDLGKTELAKSELFSIERARLNLRPGKQGNDNRDVEVRFDNRVSHIEINLIFQNHHVKDAKDVIEIAGPLQKYFPRLEVSPLIDGKIESLLSDLQHVRDSISAKTEKSIGDLTAAIAETHKQSTDRIDELSRNRQERYEELLEKHRAKVELEEARIGQFEESLREKESALNLKEPIGERRKIHEELRGKLLEQVKGFGPSKTVSLKT